MAPAMGAHDRLYQRVVNPRRSWDPGGSARRRHDVFATTALAQGHRDLTIMVLPSLLKAGRPNFRLAYWLYSADSLRGLAQIIEI